MKLKTLVWRDNVTEGGKEAGLFEILTNVKNTSITYSIRNYKYWGDAIGDKYYFFQQNGTEMIECDSVEEAKVKAQECFEQTIMKLFYVEQTSEKPNMHKIINKDIIDFRYDLIDIMCAKTYYLGAICNDGKSNVMTEDLKKVLEDILIMFNKHFSMRDYDLG